MRRGGSWEFAGGPDEIRPAPRRTVARLSAIAAVLFLTGACDRSDAPGEEPAADTTGTAVDDTMQAEPVVIGEVFLTERDTIDNVDSPSVWHGPAGEHWILTTAKETDIMLVNDAATGALIRKIGGTGAARGQLDRPNGVAVVGNTMLVVERDNARIQAFSLPALESLGTFGEDQLVRPYGLAAYEADGAIELYVTDNYEQSEDVIPPDSLLDERVEHFRVRVSGGAVDVEHVETFGETSGEGVLLL